MFSGHWIVQAAGTYYDPSYGTPGVANAGTSSAKSAYENIAFDGYFNYKLNQVGNDYEAEDRIVKENDTGKLEINIYIENIP